MWTVSLHPAAVTELGQVDKNNAMKIAQFLQGLRMADNPRSEGQGISFLWRYICSDHYIFAEIRDSDKSIVVTSVRPLPFL